MNRKQKKTLIRIIISAALLVLCSAASYMIDFPRWALLIMYLVPYLVIGYDILLKAGRGIVNGQVFDENFLMALATVGAVLLGEFREGAAVMLFYQIGELFQSAAVGKSRRNIAALMDIRPDYANVERGESVVTVDPGEVETGSVIVVKPGEKIPIDGVICEGHTSLDMSALTGESVPVSVSEGGEVKSGCINMTGLVKIRTTREFGESTVSKILELVENSRSENFISRFAGYYTPAVCAGAAALAVMGPAARIIMGLTPEWSGWIMRALTFLVISCPCALVISIPLSFFAGIGGAGREGVLVKGSNYLEALSKTKCVVFDKTGTLTKGVFEVTRVCAEGIDEAALLEYVALAESGSNHPIAKSLRNAVPAIDKTRVSGIEEIAGEGVTAVVDGKRISVGSERLMRREGAPAQCADSEGTAIHAAVDGVYAGYIVISDVIKPTAAEAVAAIKKRGVERTVMLTGDSAETAETVAAGVGIDEFYSGLLPADKVSRVEALLSEKPAKSTLAFVGDGINDAPVISRADVGIAMGALGSDAAIEAADVVLMDDNPVKIARALKIAKKCMAIVYENIIFALGVKVVCLVLGAFGMANMWLAIFADVGVMIIAVLNAIRALKIK